MQFIPDGKGKELEESTILGGEDVFFKIKQPTPTPTPTKSWFCHCPSPRLRPTKTVPISLFALCLFLLPLYMDIYSPLLDSITTETFTETTAANKNVDTMTNAIGDSGHRPTNDKNVIRNLCSTSPEKCSIQGQMSLRECQKPHPMNRIKKISGSIFIIPESNFSHADLMLFCKQGKEVKSILHAFHNISTTITTMICERRISSNATGLHEMSPAAAGSSSISSEENKQQDQHPLIAFPAWGKHKPKEFYDKPSWKDYTTGFVTPNQDMCFWPEAPQLVSDDQQQQHLSVLTKTDPIYLDKILVSGGPFDNFWHGMLILNTWCMMKDSLDVSFLVQEGKTPSYVKNFANAMGINNTRIVVHDRPVVSKSKTMYVTPFRMQGVDWSCLHDTLQVKVANENNHTEKQEYSYALVYFRRARNRPHRDIRSELHKKFAKAISKELGIAVKTFDGGETFDKQRELFSRAKIFIGPHGAGFANLVFTSKTIPVVELFSPAIAHRSCQMFGAHSFRQPLPWWPVLVDSFADEEAILGRAVSVVKQAYLYHYDYDESKIQ
jgi:hypothetical protein